MSMMSFKLKAICGIYMSKYIIINILNNILYPESYCMCPSTSVVCSSPTSCGIRNLPFPVGLSYLCSAHWKLARMSSR